MQNMGSKDRIDSGFHPTGRKGYHMPEGADFHHRGPPPETGSGYFGDESFKGGTPTMNHYGKGGRGGSHLSKEERRGIDQCLKEVAPFCSFRVMQENFAMFLHCVAEMGPRLEKDGCQDWAAEHMPCRDEFTELCNKMDPPATTECIIQHKPQLSKACVESALFVSLQHGHDDFREMMREEEQTERASKVRRGSSKGKRGRMQPDEMDFGGAEHEMKHFGFWKEKGMVDTEHMPFAEEHEEL